LTDPNPGCGMSTLMISRIGWQSGRSGALDRSGYSEQSFDEDENYSEEPFDRILLSHPRAHNIW